MSNRRALRSSASWALLGDLLPMAVAMAAAPALFAHLGAERMGVLSLLWVAVGYLSFLDLGLGRAVTVALAATRLRDDSIHAELRITGSALCALFAVGAVSSVAIGLLLYGFTVPLHFSSVAMEYEVKAAIGWTLPAVPLLLASSALRGHLEGLGAFRRLNLIRIPAGVMLVLGPLLTTQWTSDLRWAAASLFAVRALQFIALLGAVAADRRLSILELLKRLTSLAERGQLQRLLSFGGWLTVSSILGPVIVYADRFAIGLLAGAGAVSFYAIPFDVVSRVPVLVGSACAALLPTLVRAAQGTAATAPREGQWGGTLKNAWGIVGSVVILAALAGWFAAPPFLVFWMGAEFATHATGIARILLFAFLANALAQVPYIGLLSLQRTRLIAKIHILEIAPYLVVLIWSISTFGIEGAAWACLVRAVVDCALMTWALHHSADPSPIGAR